MEINKPLKSEHSTLLNARKAVVVTFIIFVIYFFGSTFLLEYKIINNTENSNMIFTLLLTIYAFFCGKLYNVMSKNIVLSFIMGILIIFLRWLAIAPLTIYLLVKSNTALKELDLNLAIPNEKMNSPVLTEENEMPITEEVFGLEGKVKKDLDYNETYNKKPYSVGASQQKELVTRGLNTLIDVKDEQHRTIEGLNEAELYYKKGNYEKAREVFKEVIRSNPDFARAHYSLGLVYRELERYNESIAAFEQALLIDSEDVQTCYSLGITYELVGEYQKAIDNFEKAVQLQSDYGKAFYHLGMNYRKMEKYPEAVENLKKAVNFLPDSADKIFYNIGMIYRKIENNEDDAIESFKKATQKNPQHADAFFYLGWLSNKKRDYEKTIEAYQEVIRIKPDYTHIYYNLGWAYGELKKYQEAVDAFREAVKQKPEDADSHYGLGWAYSNLKDYEKAVDSFKQTIRIKPDYTFAHYSLGMIHLVQGDKNAALDEYKILKDLDQDTADKLFDMIYK